MFFRNTTVPTSNLLSIETHSFLKREVDLLKYVSNRNLVDLDKLPTYDEFYNIYIKDIPERHTRLESMFNAYLQKIIYIKRFQSGEDIWKRY